jgi:hypothetical protein
MAEEKKVYTVQGTVTAVYDPRTVQSASGGRKFTSECTDVYLQTGKGGKVKVSFWNQAVDKGLVGAEVSITDLKYTGVYKEVNQFGSNKSSKIHILKGGVPVNIPVEEEDPTDPAPKNAPSVSEPEQEEPETPEPVAEVTSKKRGRPAKAQVQEVTGTATPAANQVQEPVFDPVPMAIPVMPSAEAIVLNNLQGAERIAKALGYERISMNELITLGDMVGRTAVALRIEAGKDARMDRYQK